MSGDAADELDPVQPRPRVGSIVTITDSHPATPTDGAEDPVPTAVVDALVETVWAFPGLRVSYARLIPSRRLRFLACAGPEESPELGGLTISLGANSKWLDELRDAESPVIVEDVHADRRTRDFAKQLEALDCRSMIALPVRRAGSEEMLGVTILDAPHARTWGLREITGIERLVPLVGLALENGRLRDEAHRSSERIEELERRLGAVRGVVGGVIHDTNLLVEGLMAEMARAYAQASGERREDIQRSAAALGRQLEAVLSELSTLEHGMVRLHEILDLNRLVEDIAPALRALVGTEIRMLTKLHPGTLPVRGYAPALERVLLNVVVHAHNVPPTGDALIVETLVADGNAVVQLRGNALGLDEPLRQLQFNDDEATHNADAIGLGLWLARSEVMLHGGTLEVQVDPGPHARILLSLPLAD